MFSLQRLDGREVYDYRNVQISLREEHVEVQLGGTRSVIMSIIRELSMNDSPPSLPGWP